MDKLFGDVELVYALWIGIDGYVNKVIIKILQIIRVISRDPEGCYYCCSAMFR